MAGHAYALHRQARNSIQNVNKKFNQLEPLQLPSGSTEALGSTRKTAKKSGISNLAAAIQTSISARKKVVLVPPLQPNCTSFTEQKSTSTTKIQINKSTDPDTKSDSGRESDEPNISVVTVGSSLDASSSLNGLKINVEQKKIKPPPPPRSSQTKLSSVVNSQPKPKSILSPTSSLNTLESLELSPTEALDKLIRNVGNNRSKKRVKFNPKIDIDSMKPLEAG